MHACACDRTAGQILNVAFVCMLYGGAMPLLHWVAPVAFIISFWTEKFELLKAGAHAGFWVLDETITVDLVLIRI